MAATQMMCARIGMVTDKGLAGALKEKFPKPLVAMAATALFTANTINIGADLMGMADAANMVTGWNPHLCVALFGIGIAFATIRCRYEQIANILKWLALSLFSYVITAFIIHPDWKSVLAGTFLPSLPRGHDAWAMLVAILGTTISPYLFFWQSSMEVEEKNASGRSMWPGRKVKQGDLINRKIDVGAGAFFSNAVMYFIILTTALTLHAGGNTHIGTSRQAAEALKPLAGSLASLLFALGLIGVGLLSIPTLAGSAAYALAETWRWRRGLDAPFNRAKLFYIVIILCIAIGIAFDLAHINPVKALFWSAVINGLLAPFLLTGILAVACDSKIMRNQRSSRLGLAGVALTTLLMFGTAAGMFIF
jgi:Mn2+/Fe2+ NRAMP family transporter